MDFKKTNAPTSTVTRNLMDLCRDTNNIYESVAIISKRSNQIAAEMKDELSRYTLRVEQKLLDKLGYIAEYEGRTKNRELEQMIKKRIRDFEQEHGEITLE